MTRRLWGLVKKSRKAQALILLLAAAVVSDAVYYFVICQPVSDQAAALGSRLNGLEARYKKSQDAIRRYEEFKKGREDLLKFKSLLASRLEYTDVIKKVYTLAKKDGMRYSSFGAQTSELRQVGGLEQISFLLPVSGSYRNVRKFIYDVETSDLFLTINQLGLASAGEGGGGISLSIGLSTYVRS